MKVTRRYDVPAALEAASGFDHDYVDLFVANVPGADRTPPEQWARASMEGASRAGRFLAWQTVLALRLDLSPGPERITGWQITERTEDFIRVEAPSWHLSARMVFRTQPDEVQFATFIRYDRAISRAIWGALSAVHRTAAPGFLAGGVRRALA